MDFVILDVYFDVKPVPEEVQSCNCSLPTEPKQMGCGEDCMNRILNFECTPGICRLGSRCSNMKIQKHEWHSGIQRFMTKDKVRFTYPNYQQLFILGTDKATGQHKKSVVCSPK